MQRGCFAGLDSELEHVFKDTGTHQVWVLQAKSRDCQDDKELVTAQAHKEDGYRWWVQRLSRMFQLHDEVRIDHFRGFAGAQSYLSPEAVQHTAPDPRKHAKLPCTFHPRKTIVC